ncbi:MAG: haloacid dehalogenase type II [Ktedonobacteraceae bacterium]|nr:haloacid dehalogenase type II [Ktedonobacteraceae bacterium]
MVDLQQVKVLAFDVFGTVVDYRSTIVREGEELSRAKGLDVDWAGFASEWRARYQPELNRIIRGEEPWVKLDVVHRRALDEVLALFAIDTLSEDEKVEFNRVWHRLQPWPDALAGLTRLRSRFTLATLSNGNVSLLVEMTKHSGLPWDVILSAELAHAYKPDPRVYQMATDLLDLSPQEIMLVAAHPYDLQAAYALGWHTAYVSRLGETDVSQPPDPTLLASFDITATDFEDLARQLGA